MKKFKFPKNILLVVAMLNTIVAAIYYFIGYTNNAFFSISKYVTFSLIFMYFSIAFYHDIKIKKNS